MGASLRSRRTSNLAAYSLVGAVALAACNQLFSIEKPARSSSAANGGAGTLDGGGGSSGSSPTTETTADVGGTGGSTASGGSTSGVGGTEGDSSTGGGGGSDTTNNDTTNDTTSGGGSGGTSSTDGTSSTGGASTGGGTSTGGTSSTGGGTSAGGATASDTASMTVTTGVIEPPDPCEGEDLRGPLLIEIAAGTGVIGNGVEDDNAAPIINPEFDVFCIDETEVTVAQYQECVEDDGCDPPRDDLPDQCPEATPRPDDHPVGCVDYQHAADYCEWAGKRLPTEKEWEYAARGPEGRPYPWGDAALADTRLNWNGVVGATTPVKSYPDGATPEGVYDMAGNVWEWTSSTWCSDYSTSPDECDPSVYVPRGGSYVSADRFVSPSYRDGDNDPDQRFGFRCAFGPGER